MKRSTHFLSWLTALATVACGATTNDGDGGVGGLPSDAGAVDPGASGRGGAGANTGGATSSDGGSTTTSGASGLSGVLPVCNAPSGLATGATRDCDGPLPVLDPNVFVGCESSAICTYSCGEACIEGFSYCPAEGTGAIAEPRALIPSRRPRDWAGVVRLVIAATDGDCVFGAVDYDIEGMRLLPPREHSCTVTTRVLSHCAVRQEMTCTSATTDYGISFDLEWDERRGFWAGTGEVSSLLHGSAGPACVSHGHVVALPP